MIENESESEPRSDRFIKFDLSKRKSGPFDYSIEQQCLSKRKSSCPVSNEFLQSPLGKEVKNHHDQYPGYHYFTTMNSCREIMKVQLLNEYDELSISQLLNGSPIQPQHISKPIRKAIEHFGYSRIYSEDYISGLVTKEKMENKTPSIWDEDQKQILIWACIKISNSRQLETELFSTEIWDDIATLFQNRSGKDCKRQWKITQKAFLSKQPWTEEEDLQLLLIIQSYLERMSLGEIIWREIAAEYNHKGFPVRSESSCKHRWQNRLDPNLSKEPWNNEEDLQMLGLVLTFGKRWRYIQQDWKLKNKRTQKQMAQRFKILIENEKKFFTPLHCIPKSRREITTIQDSGYDSDTSSCSSTRDTQLTNLEKKTITELIKNLQDSFHRPLHKDLMQSEKDEKCLALQKNKLMNLVQHDLQMSERNIKISREVNDKGSRMSIERPSIEQLSSINTPLMVSNLTRTLSGMNISGVPDPLQVTLKIEPLERLDLRDMNDLEFSVVNKKTGSIFLLTQDDLRQLMEQIEERRFQEDLNDMEQ